MAFPDYGDVTKALLDKLRPQIVEAVTKQNAFYSHYKGYGGMPNDTIGYANGDAQTGETVTITMAGTSVAPGGQFQFSENTVWTTSAPETWYMTNPQYFEYAGGSTPPVVVAAPAPPEEVPEVPPVEPKRGRMIKLGRK